MSVQNMVVNKVGLDDQWLYRAGGISALAIGVGYIIIIALFVPLGAPPTGAEAWLTYIAAKSSLWQAILAISVLTDFLFVPAALALYLALKAINRNMMLLAITCVGLFVLLDLALTQINYAALISLSGNYSAATTDAQRAGIVAAAQYPSSVLDSVLLFVYNTLTLSVGILLIGFVMLKGSFSKSTAYLGLATGALGILAVAGSFVIDTTIITIIASTLTTVWALFVGYRLFRLG